MNSTQEKEITSPLIFSTAAAEKVKELINGEDNDALMLRVFISGGGCSGFQYGFSFDHDIDEEDTCITKDGANLVVDPLSLQYLAGSTIDYSEDLSGSKFIVKNPNAITTCGCGESFSI